MNNEMLKNHFSRYIKLAAEKIIQANENRTDNLKRERALKLYWHMAGIAEGIGIALEIDSRDVFIIIDRKVVELQESEW